MCKQKEIESNYTTCFNHEHIERNDANKVFS
jgi:hypothetical protein